MIDDDDLIFLTFLKPRRNETALRLRNSLFVGRVIRHHNPPLRLFIAAVVTYTVVCNAVIPEPIPSKSRLGSADGEKVVFL